MALQMNITKLYENTNCKKRPSKDTKIQKYTCASLQCVSRQRAGYVDTNDIYKTTQKYKIQETP